MLELPNVQGSPELSAEKGKTYEQCIYNKLYEKRYSIINENMYNN